MVLHCDFEFRSLWEVRGLATPSEIGLLLADKR